MAKLWGVKMRWGMRRRRWRRTTWRRRRWRRRGGGGVSGEAEIWTCLPFYQEIDPTNRRPYESPEEPEMKEHLL